MRNRTSFRRSNRLHTLATASRARHWVAGVGFFPLLALAQGEPHPDKLEEVIVTGEKIERSLQETISSVAVLDAGALEDAGISTLTEIIRLIPNVSTATFGGYAIRGVQDVGVTDNPSFIGEPTLTLITDGAPQSQLALQGGALNLWDVKKVEVYRGPQSTIQGRNALAGAMVIETNRPTYEWEAGARVGAGSDNAQRYAAVISGPIVGNQVAFRLSYDQQEMDSQNRALDPVVDAQTAGKYRTARARLLIEPEAIPDLSIIATYVDSFTEDPYTNASGPDFFARISDEPSNNFFDTNYNPHVDSSIWIVDASYDINERWTVRSTSSRTNSDLINNTYDNAAGVTEQHNPEFSQEVRVNFNTDRLEGVFGVYYSEREYDFKADIPGSLTGYINNQTGEIRALFADVTWSLADDWRLTLGARAEEQELDVDTSRAAVPASGITAASVYETSDFSAFLPKIALAHDIRDNLTVAASVQRAYRNGGVFVQAFSPDFTPFDYDPEFTTNYELSARTTLADGRVFLSGNVFYVDWTDQQVTIEGVVPGFDRKIINAGESELYGAEVELRARLTTDWTLGGGLGYTHTEYTKFLTADGDFSGNRFRHAPELTGTVDLAYLSASGISFGVNARYTDGFFSDAENIPEQAVEAYTLVNARAGYAWETGNWSVRVNVYGDNLLDEEYFYTKSSLVSSGRAQLGMGRTYGVGMEVHWR